MRVVFLGTPPPAVPTLTALLEAGHDVPLVVTNPDRPAGRSGRPVASAVKRAAVERGLPVFQPRRVRNDAFRDRLGALAPDALIVVAYGRILPVPVLGIAARGAINVHFSLLPALRGAAPVQWALARGETVSGVTTMRLDAGMDTGPLLMSREVPIEPDEHAPQLQRRLAVVGAELLVETLDGLARGTITEKAQDEERATLAPLLRREDGEVEPGLPAAAIAGRVRGFDPWPGVWLRHRDRRLRLVAARAVAGPAGAPPGTVLGLDGDALLLACGEETRLAVSRAQPEGRRAVSGRDLLNGRFVAVGERLTAIERRDSSCPE